MGLLSRMAAILKSMMGSFLDNVEDPQATLDYSYQKQIELLQNVKRGVVEVTTARRRLELQAARLTDNAARLDEQARQALSAGREDLARAALERKQVLLAQGQDLQGQIRGLQQEQEKLETAESRLALKVEAFRTRKETINAQYSAAEAQVRIGEAVTGLSEEMADVGYAVQRVQDKVDKMQARAGAIDELIASGVLEDVTGGKDLVERELQKISVAEGVEQDLTRMKQQIGMPSQPRPLEEHR